MTTEERDDLLTDSAQVRDEVIDGANTATRVGTLFTNIVNFAYKAWLGITDETTHLLTPKEIREGSGADTKLITSEEADTKIATEVPAINPNQVIVTNTGQAKIISLFDKSESSAVSLDANTEYGTEALPIYDQFTITKINARHLNGALMVHSGLEKPFFLTPQKPTSPLPIYASQAAMTADFINQEEGEYYYYTGSTSAWQYDGTGTDNIANYEELEAIAGWSESGLQPPWLYVTGTYLTGLANVNHLHFTYYRSNPDDLGKLDYVECKIVPITNGNLDPEPPLSQDPELRAFFEMEETTNLNIAIDSSIYGNDATEVITTSTATRVAGIFGNALKINAASFNTRYVIPFDASINPTNGFTWMGWVKLVSGSTNTYGIAGMGYETGSGFDNGWRLHITSTTATTPLRIEFPTRSNANTFNSNTAGNVVDDGVWQHIAVSYDMQVKRVFVDGQVVLTSAAYTANIALKADATNDETVQANNGLNVFGGSLNNGSRPNTEIDKVKYYTRGLSPQEVLDIYNAENALIE
jgi:hypothetical protein